MVADGHTPNCCVYNSVIDNLGKAGKLDMALHVFGDMIGSDCSPDVVTYSCLIDIMARCGRIEEAYKYLERMRAEGLKADVWV
ncbi:hypothetical protein R1flu_006621 [Riccia fluitans]|uniref:Pentatricopeptide repeat-containing protein n=1 Tax=Riccia fluitans TaxID=41844 RepID=A0ABD1YZK0_9MARC